MVKIIFNDNNYNDNNTNNNNDNKELPEEN